MSTSTAVATSSGPASTGSTLSRYGVFVRRSVVRFGRRPDTVVATVMFPLVLMLTMLAVFSTAVEAFDNGDYAQRLVPGLTVSGILFGSLGTATGFWIELETGFMDRIRSMPVPALGPLIGTVAAEAVRAVMAVFVLVAVGSFFGFRFEQGVVWAVPYLAVAIAASWTFAWIGMFMATVATSQEALVPPLNAIYLVLLFFSEGLVPLDAYPGWARPIVEWNPATAYVTLLDGLARGGPLVRPGLLAAGWSVAIIVVFGSLAVRRIKR